MVRWRGGAASRVSATSTTPRVEGAAVPGTRVDGAARRRASMREVADLADVAISSVSRVLSGHPDVAAVMRDRVLSAVRQLEYEPDFLAQSLRRGQTLSVGFVLADISNPLMADIVLGAEATLRSAGYSLLLMNSENDPALDAAHIRFFQSRRVDGMLLSLASETDPGTLEMVRQLDVPAVLVDRDAAGRHAPAPSSTTTARAWKRPWSTSVELGHRNIALITGSVAHAARPGAHRRPCEQVARRRPEQVRALYRPGSFSAEFGAGGDARLLALRPGLRPSSPAATSCSSAACGRCRTKASESAPTSRW